MKSWKSFGMWIGLAWVAIKARRGDLNLLSRDGAQLDLVAPHISKWEWIVFEENRSMVELSDLFPMTCVMDGQGKWIWEWMEMLMFEMKMKRVGGKGVRCCLASHCLIDLEKTFCENFSENLSFLWSSSERRHSTFPSERCHVTR